MPVINPMAANTSVTQTPGAPSQDLGEQEFLNLLMTQLGNQDPLNPMESAQFAEQVASMNQVKQLMGANERLDQLMMGMTSMNNQSAVQLVGKEVIAQGDGIQHAEGGTHELNFEMPHKVERLTVTVRDADGNIVRTLDRDEADAGMQTIHWNGKNDQGVMADPGEYTFDVVAETPDGEPVLGTTYVRGIVEELRFDEGYPMLSINGTAIGMDQILRVLDAEPLAGAEVPTALPETDPDAATPPTEPNVSAFRFYPNVPNNS